MLLPPLLELVLLCCLCCLQGFCGGLQAAQAAGQLHLAACVSCGVAGRPHQYSASQVAAVLSAGACRGFVEGYRQRKLQDSFWGSPWRSITIDWVDNPVDRCALFVWLPCCCFQVYGCAQHHHRLGGQPRGQVCAVCVGAMLLCSSVWLCAAYALLDWVNIPVDRCVLRCRAVGLACSWFGLAAVTAVSDQRWTGACCSWLPCCWLQVFGCAQHHHRLDGQCSGQVHCWHCWLLLLCASHFTAAPW